MDLKPTLCEKCGWFKIDDCESESNPICDVCNSPMIYINELSYVEKAHMSNEESEQFAINYIGHDFDPELKAKRIAYDNNRNAEISAICNKPVPKCPTCQSTNLPKYPL